MNIIEFIYFYFCLYCDVVVDRDNHIGKNLIFWQLQMKLTFKWIFWFPLFFFLEVEQQRCDLKVEQQNMWAACCCRNIYYLSISSHRLSHRAPSLSHIITFIEKVFWHIRHSDVHILHLWKHLPLHIIIRLPCWPAAACRRCSSPLCNALLTWNRFAAHTCWKSSAARERASIWRLTVTMAGSVSLMQC